MDPGAPTTPEPTHPPSAPDSGLQGQPPTVPFPGEQASGEEGHHDFDAQKRIHQQIRNDPDYDDWEYGTEPLPHEAWGEGKATPDRPPATKEAP